MRLYAPQYYKNFRCIADRCEHSCCVGWEIDIDGDTLEKYQSLTESYGAVIDDSISREDTPQFKLCAQDRCPHLDERGLCRIITSVGEEYLCDICREHPRFYNFTNVAEVGIGMSCTEAARVILSSPDYDVFEEIGTHSASEDTVDFDGRTERGRLYGILKDHGTAYPQRLAEIYGEYGIVVEADEAWRAILDSLEYLDHTHRGRFACYSAHLRPAGMDEYLERALAYWIYRHCTEAEGREDFAIRLRFCLFCERLLASLAVSEGAASLREIAVLARIISEEIEYSDENTEALMLG